MIDTIMKESLDVSIGANKAIVALPRRQNCSKYHASHFLSTDYQSIHACFRSYLCN